MSRVGITPFSAGAVTVAAVDRETVCYSEIKKNFAADDSD